MRLLDARNAPLSRPPGPSALVASLVRSLAASRSAAAAAAMLPQRGPRPPAFPRGPRPLGFAERASLAKQEAERKAAEAERLAKEQAECVAARAARVEAIQRKAEALERVAKERAERNNKAKEEAERKAKEEEAERKAEEEAERKAKEEAERKAKEDAEGKKAEAKRRRSPGFELYPGAWGPPRHWRLQHGIPVDSSSDDETARAAAREWHAERMARVAARRLQSQSLAHQSP